MQSSDKARAHAADMIAEQQRLEAIGIRAAMPIMRKVRTDAIRKFKAGGDPVASITKNLRGLVPIVQRGMVAAHLQGRLRSLVTGARARGEPLALAQPYNAAIDFLVRRLDLTDSQVSSISAMYGPAAEEVIASVGDAAKRIIGPAMLDISKKGLHVKDGMAALRKALTSAGVDPGTPWMLETTYRTQTSIGYSAGQWSADQDPAIQDILRAYEYVTVGDDQVRPNHAALDGLVRPKDDPIWKRVWPPNGWRCRCSVIAAFDGDDLPFTKLPSTVKIDGASVVPGPDDGWNFHVGEVFADTLNLATV